MEEKNLCKISSVSKRNAVVFSLESSDYEPDYEKMAVLLVKSIRDHNKDIDIICGIFTNRIPGIETLDLLLKYDVQIVFDKQFEVEEDSVNYFLRNYTIFYFDYLQRTHNVLYLDIDVICLGDLTSVFNNDAFIVEEVPDYIVQLEQSYIGSIDHKLYYNWVHRLTPESTEVYDIDYNQYQYLKESDIEISKRIANIPVTNQNFGAYYPKHELSNSSLLFHYDGFIDSGTFYKLQNHPKYKLYTLFIDNVLKIKRNNNENYWEAL